MKIIKTEWYPAIIKPARAGWYERDYTGVLPEGEQQIYRDLWILVSKCDGYWYVDEPAGEINDAYYEELPWRGLTRPAKARKETP